MKNFIILLGLFSVLLSITSCETQEIKDETGLETESLQGTEKEDILGPGEEDGTDEQ